MLSENDMSICVGWLNCIFFWPVVTIGFSGLSREISVCCHKVSTDVRLVERSSKGLPRNQEGWKHIKGPSAFTSGLHRRVYAYLHIRP